MDLKLFFNGVSDTLNEKSRRSVAASLAMSIGFGGISQVSKASRLSRPAIYAGIKELKNPEASVLSDERQRKVGAGRKLAEKQDSTLISDLDKLIEPHTSGNPMNPLRWVNKSLRILSMQMNKQGHKTSRTLISRLLKNMGYTLQSNRKSKEVSSQDPDRNAQFEYISEKAKEFHLNNQPVISVDTKKKELVGDFKNNGKVYCPKSKPENVRVHDFIIPELGRAIPYGVYDVNKNEGWVNVGIDHDTAEFAVETIRKWWLKMGKEEYPEARELFITADGGGSNGSRSRLWKVELQKLSSEIGLTIHVSHLPPGTSKWNKIEHRMFSYISMNWRGKPLISYQVIVNLIASTKTTTGLKIKATLDKRKYPAGIKVSNYDYEALNIRENNFKGNWNYVIKPH
jgi:hypothetical protein